MLAVSSAANHRTATNIFLQIYASRIAALETQILVEPRPPADITKELHLLGNDLKGGCHMAQNAL